MIQLFAYREDFEFLSSSNQLIDVIESYPNLKINLVRSNNLSSHSFERDREIFNEFLKTQEKFAVVLKQIPNNPIYLLRQLSSFNPNEDVDFLQFLQLKRKFFLDRGRIRLLAEYRHVFLYWALSLPLVKWVDSLLGLVSNSKFTLLKNLRRRRLRILSRSRSDISFGKENFLGSLFIPGQTEENCTRYLISRDCATSLVDFNSEQLLSSDMVFLGISRAGNFRTGRIS
jgi:hypothetical protein